MTTDQPFPSSEGIRSGSLFVVLDDLYEGTAIAAAAASSVGFNEVNALASLSGGLLQVAVSPNRAEQFLLTPQLRLPHSDTTPGDWLVSVEARQGVGSGISINDRLTTIRTLGSPSPHASDLVRPGHLFPYRCKVGGVLKRMALPEAALDLVIGQGLPDAAVFSTLLNTNGDRMTLDEAREWGASRGLSIFTLSQIIESRLAKEPLIELIARSQLPVACAGYRGGESAQEPQFTAHLYRSRVDGTEHVALTHGKVRNDLPVTVRVHVEDPIEDLVGDSRGPSSRSLLQRCITLLAEAEAGVLIYLRQSPVEPTAPRNHSLGTDEGQRASLRDKAPPSQQRPLVREYGIGAQILRHLGVSQLTLLTRSARQFDGLKPFGLTVVEQRVIS
jgi:3,4-dihydroxy 2-butanone 4-phosphate synthase/GTP cyclohydrolase II